MGASHGIYLAGLKKLYTVVVFQTVFHYLLHTHNHRMQLKQDTLNM